MNKFTLLGKGFVQILFSALVVFSSIFFGRTFSQSAGFNNTFAILSINGGANAYYDLNATTANTDFNGANLGTFNPASQSLTLRGAEHNVWRCGSSDLTSTRLMYRVFPAGSPSGSFSSINIPYFSGSNNGCGGQDQRWQETAGSVNVLSGLAPGNYTLQVYSEATVTNCCGGMVYASNLGNNYSANFTIAGNYVTTNGGSGLAATYTTLASAITALNAATITSPVVITLYGNETAPAGGYNITKAGTSTNTITIQGNGPLNTIVTASASHTAGSLNDAIFKITGADWITIRNFAMQESANTTTTAGSNNMTEFGVALFYASTTDGAQNCTIQGNTISLNRTYQNSIGVYSNSTHSASNVTTSATATSSTGGNSGLKIYGNTISNINLGIVVVGPTAAADANTGIDIGGTSSSTGNTISNFGTTGTFSGFVNISGTVNGILVRNSNGFNVSYNSITSSNGGVSSGTLNGIQIQASSNTPTGTFTNTISFNTISLQTGFATGAINGINYPAGSASSTSVLNITDNNFTRMNSSVTTSGAFDAILVASTNLTTNISNNTFTNLTVNTTGNFRFIAHSFTMPASGSTTINNNSIVTGFNKNQAGGTVTITTTNGSSPNSASLTQTNNNFSNITVTGATGITGFNNTDGAGTSCSKTITGNSFNNWTGGSSAISAMNFTYWGGATTNTLSNNTITNITGQGSITGVNIGSTFGSTNTLTFSNNTITDLSSTGTGGTVLAFTCSNTSSTINISGNTVGALSSTAATVTGISVSGSTANNIFNNKVYNLSSSNTSPTVTGIIASAGSTNTIYNNLIGNITAPSANSANPIIGLNLSGGTTVNASYNTIYLNNVSSSGGLFGASGIFASTSPTLTLRNNLVRVTGTANGSSNIAAFRRSTSTLTSYSTSSNNNLFFAGTPSATNLIYTENTSSFTNSQQTLSSYKSFMSTRDQASQSIDPTFTSTVGTNSGFLHIDPSSNNIGIEGAGVVVSGITTDFDGDTRNVSTPDIGADEFTSVISCATTPSPTNSATAVAQTTTLSWTAATNATSYDVYLGTDIAATNIVNGTNQVGTTYTPSSILSPSTTYYWKIIPKNGSNAATGCSTWSFTTDAAVPALTPTSLTAFGSVCTTTTSTNTFSMTAVNLTGSFVTITAPTGYTVSEDNSTFSSSINVNHSSGSFTNKIIYVRFSPNSATTFSGNIVINGGGLSSDVNVAASGTGIVAVSGLSYAVNPAIYCTSTAITANTPSLAVSGGTVGYGSGSSLPAGLTLNSSTGAITGTPTATSSATDYTINASNACGSTSVALNITVVARLTALTYTSSSITACAGSAITPNTVASVTSGSGTLTYSVSPALPTGLSIDANTGTISGTSSAIQASTPYTITVSNGCSSTTATVNIAINSTFNGTYSVGAGQTYTTLTAAVAAYNSSCVDGPVVFNLIDATYSTSETFPITINANTGASSTNTLTIKPASGNTVTITGSVNSAGLIRLNGADYVIIDGSNNGTSSRDLTITNSSTTSPVGVLISSLGSGAGATFSTIKNTNITTGTSTGSYGISVGGSSGGSTGSDNDNITLHNNNISTGIANGIYASGTATTSSGGNDNLTISDNVITINTTSATYGVRVLNSLTSTISGNTIDVLTSGATQPVGISLETGFLNSSVLRNNITQSRTTNTGGYGGRGITIGTGSASSSLTIANNMISGVNGSNYSSFTNSSSMGICIGTLGNSGTLTTTAGGINLYYNSIAMTGDYSYSASCLTAGVYVGSGASALDVRNNIITNSMNNTNGSGGSSKNYAIYSVAANTAYSTIDYNDFYVSGSQGVLGYLSSDRTNISGIQSGFGQNVNSVNIAPVFTSASNLRLVATSNPTLNNLGTTVSVTTDIDGVTRGASPDMGVNEITPPAEDAGITAAVINYCPGSQNVSVTLKNFGLTSLTSATIDWSLNGVAQTPYNWTGSLASGATTSVTVGTYTFVGNTNYVLVASSSLPNGVADATTGNDSFTSGTFQTGLSGTYTVGAGQDFATLTAAVASANTNGLCGPTVFSLTDATYSSSETFPITITELAGSSTTNTLTIRPASGVNAAITGSNTQAIIRINGADNIIIDGSNNGTNTKNLTIENTNTGTSSNGIWVSSASSSNGANNVTIKNSIVKGNAPTTTFAAIVASSGTTVGNAAEAANDNLVIQNNTVMDAQYGIGVVGNASYQNGTVITENLVGSNTAAEYIGWRGIYVQNVNAVTLTKNTIWNIIVSGALDVSGIHVASGVVNGTISSNNIYNIRSTSTSGYGAYGINFSSATGTTGVLVSNNMISGILTSNYSTSSTQYNAFGIRIAAVVPNLKIYNNSIHLSGSVTTGSSAGMSAAFCTTVAVTGLDVRNNIFSNTQTFGVSGSSAYSVYLTSGTTFSQINYNNYTGTSGTNTTYRLGYNGSANVADLTAWRTFTTADAQSISVQPTFTSSVDLHLDPSGNTSINAAGVVLADVPSDYDGDTRDVSTPDIGADEFTPLICSTATGGTATAATPTICTTGSSVLNATGYSIGVGSTYQWESSSSLAFTSPTNLGASSSTYVPGSTGTITSTTYYRLKVTCSADPLNPSYSNIVTVSVVSAATLTISPNTSVCTGGSTTLTVSGAVSYTWAPSTGLSATTGTSVTASPTASTTYTITALDANGCSPTGTVAVAVNLIPSAISASQSPSVVCAGDVLTLTSTGGDVPNTASDYSVAISSGNSLNSVSSPTGSLLAQNLDDNASSLTDIGFTFRFAGTDYTQFWVNSNGVVGLGGTTFTATGNTFTGASSYPVLYPFYDDLGTNAGGITYKLTGSAPNRILTIDFQMGDCCGSTSAATIVYQVVLSETSNTVRFIYGSGLTSGLDGSIGIASSSSSFISFTAPGNTFSTSTSNNLNSTLPTSGVSYLFTPPSTNKTWSPITDLYTDAAGTVAYTGTSATTVYARNTTATTYTVTAANGSCTSTNTVTTSINALPTISSASATICYGQSTTLSASGAVSYTWSPSTGLSSNTGSSVSANSAATTTYTITGVDANNCQNTTTATVTVNPVIVITSQPSNAVVLENATANFSVTATGVGLTYQWQESTNSGTSWSNISGANSSTYSYTSVPLSADGYQYRCIVGGSPCSDVTSNAVTLTISNTAIVTQPANQTICSSDNAVFSITTSGTTPTYQWQVSTNSGLSWTDLTGETNSTLTLSGLTSSSSSNQYRCVLSGTINSDPAILTVYNVPTITSQPTNLTVCSNDVSGGFSATATGSNLTYQWQLSTNGGSSWANIDAETNPTLSFNSFTNSMDGYKYRLVVSGTSPCSPATSDVVTLSVVGATASSNVASICLNQSVTLTATPTASSSGLTYSWSSSAGGGASTPVTGSPATITPTAAGAYTYTLTATGMSCTVTSTVNVTVNALPSITTATATPTPICSGSSINLDAKSIQSVSSTITLGTGSTTSTSAATNPFYGGYGGVKTQYLFRASELTAQNLVMGNITSIGFDVTSVGATLNGFAINISHTSLTALTTNLENVTNNVFSVSSFTPTSGVNTINFNTPFNWDGTSNIIISFCWSNNNTSNTATTLKVYSPGFTSSNARYVDSRSSTDVCSYTGSTLPSGWNGGATTTTSRPIFILGGQVGTVLTSSLNWSWNSTPIVSTAAGTTTGVNNTNSPTTVNYTVTATNPTTGCSNTATTANVTINPVPPTPTANSTSICGAQNATCSVTGSGLGGNTFNWYTVSTGGTALAAQTGSSLTAYPVATTTTFYVSETNGNCESPRVAVTQTVTSAPTISVSASSATICSGVSTTLTASSSNPDYTYSWSNSLGTGSSVTASPTSTTTFTVTGSDVSGCSNSNTIIITVNPIPSSIVASASPSAVCSGQSLSLTANANSNVSTNQVLVNPAVEGGFESGTTFALNGWVGVTTGTRTFRIGTVTTPYAGTNSVYVGNTTSNNGINSSTTHHFYRDVAIPANASNISLRFYLSLPSIDVSGSTVYDYLNVYTTTTSNTPVVGTVPSTNYTLLSQFGGTVISGYTLQTLPISSSLSGTTVRIVFSWRSDGVSPHVAPIIDNIGLTADVAVLPTYSWTSTPAGFTSSSQNPTSFVPTATTRYNLSVSNSHGCTDTSSVLVTVNSPSSASSSVNASTTAVCSGDLVTLTQTGGSLGTNAIWAWYSDAAYTSLIGTSSSSNASLNVNPLMSTTYYLRAEGTASPCTSNVPSGNIAVSVSMPTLPVTVADGDYVWLGSNNDDWATASNWRQWTQATTSYSVPSTSPNSSLNSVILPGTSSCVLNDVKLNNTTSSVKDLVIGAGRTFALNHASAVLNVFGAITNSGTWSTPVAGSTVNFNATGAQTIPVLDYSNLQTSGSGVKTLGGDLAVAQVITVGSGTTLALSTNTLSLSYVGTPMVISGAFDSGTGTVVYNGSGAQNLASATYYNLKTDGSGNKTLGGTTTVTNELSLEDGVLVVAANTLNLNGNSILRNNGSINASNTDATLIFGNTSSLTLPSNVFSAAVNNLTLNNARVKSTSDFTVNGILNLNNTNPSAVDGLLDLVQSYGSYGNTNSANSTDGNNNLSSAVLTLGASATVTGSGDVTGKVRRTSISSGTTYSFGNSNLQLTFTQNGGTLPSEVTVVQTKGSEGLHVSKDGNHSTGYNGLIGGAAVQRLFQILRTGGDDVATCSVRLPYQDSELNGNTEGSLVTWVHEIPFSGLSPHEQGKSTNNTTNNWVQWNDFPVDYLATEGNTSSTKYWMLANRQSSDTLWIGGANANWSNIANWSSGVLPTTTTKVVVNPSIYKDALTINGTFNVGSLSIENSGIVNGGNGELTLNNNLNTWVNNGTFNSGTSTVVFNTTDGTIVGNTEFYNLTVATNKKVTIGENVESTIIGLIENNGTLDATTNVNTIVFAGSDQAIPTPNGTIPGFYHLKIDQNSGSASAISQINTVGDLIVENGTFDLLGNSAFIGGNLVNNASISNAIELYMSGTGNQSIGGSNPITTELLLITGVSGTTTINQDVTVNQILYVEGSKTLNGGDHEIKLAGSSQPFILEGTFNAGTGTVNYTSLDPTDILPISYYNLKSEGAVSKALMGNTVVENTLTLDGTLLDISTNSLSIGNSPVTMNGGALKVDAGTLELTNSTSMTIPASIIDGSTFNHLTLNGAGGVTLSDDMSLIGDLVLTEGNLNLGSSTMTFDSDATISGTNGLINAGTGGLIYKAATLDVSFLTSSDVNNLEIDRASGTVELNNGNLNVTNTFTLTSGTFDVNANELRLSGAISHTGGSLDVDAGTIDFNNSSDITLTAGLFAGDIKDLKMSGNGGLELGESIRVTNTLTMNGGDIVTDATKLLEIGSSASNPGLVNWSSTSNASVVGPMKRWFGTAANSSAASGVFPVGTADFNRYAQINFTSASSGGYIMMEYQLGMPSNMYDLPMSYTVNGATRFIQNADETGYWSITPYNAAGVAYGSLDNVPYNITLRINQPVTVAANGPLQDPPSMRIIRAKGNPDATHNDWEIGNSAATINAILPGYDYIVTSSNLTGFSWFNIGGDNSTPLPVELLSFSGVCEGNSHLITWKTASEHNSDYFEVQVSRDGENWTSVNNQPAAGFSTSLITYNFTNFNVDGNNLYYRLRQVDFNGEEKISEVVLIGCSLEGKLYLTYPNPSSSEFNLRIDDETVQGEVLIQIVDGRGAVLNQRTVDVSEGVNMLYFNEMLPSGMYFIKIIKEGKQHFILKHSIR